MCIQYGVENVSGSQDEWHAGFEDWGYNKECYRSFYHCGISTSAFDFVNKVTYHIMFKHSYIYFHGCHKIRSVTIITVTF